MPFTRISPRISPRIVSLAPSATSILCSVGAKKSLVGVSKWCPAVAPVSHLPKFGDCWQLNNVAAIQALKPKSLADIDRDILQLGALTNRTAAAHKLIHNMHREFESISRRARNQPRLRVYSEARSEERR